MLNNHNMPKSTIQHLTTALCLTLLLTLRTALAQSQPPTHGDLNQLVTGPP